MLFAPKAATHSDAAPHKTLTSAYPTSFDPRVGAWSSYIHPVRDQGNCGSCWAFTASGMLEDRIAIATSG